MKICIKYLCRVMSASSIYQSVLAVSFTFIFRQFKSSLKNFPREPDWPLLH